MAQNLKRLNKYITRLSEDLAEYNKREQTGEVTKSERRNMRRRINRVVANIKRDATPLIEQANETYTHLAENNIETLSMINVKESLNREYFTLATNNYNDLITEVTLAMDFVGNLENNVLTANRLDRNKNLYNLYSPEERESLRNKTYLETDLFISEEQAKRIFSNYRRIEEQYKAEIGKQGGDAVYGSENLILFMIDEENRGHDSFEMGWAAMQDFRLERLPEFQSMLHERVESAKNLSPLFKGEDFYGKLSGLL